MRAAEIFDCVHALVIQLRTTEARIGSVLDMPAPSGRGPAGNTRAEYVADFAIAGRRVLAKHPKRLKVFQLFYCQGLPYTLALKHSGLKKGTFDWFCAQVKKTVGPELARVGLFPPRNYRKRSANADS